MTLIALDLNHFKMVNDTHGHGVGGKVLVGVGSRLKACTRLSDSCLRMGGEEILCLLYGSDSANAINIVENMRRSFAESKAVAGHKLTCSFGIATYDGEESWEQWCLRVDDYLYKAKAAGRDCAIQ